MIYIKKEKVLKISGVAEATGTCGEREKTCRETTPEIWGDSWATQSLVSEGQAESTGWETESLKDSGGHRILEKCWGLYPARVERPWWMLHASG